MWSRDESLGDLTHTLVVPLSPSSSALHSALIENGILCGGSSGKLNFIEATSGAILWSRLLNGNYSR